MDVYILDDQLRRIEVVDYYISAIWTERFFDIGDFQIVIASTPEVRALFKTGTHLAINTSYRVMTVETVEDKTDTDGNDILTITGHSIEDILADRVIRNELVDLATEANWTLTNTPGNIARGMFQHICRDGALNIGDKIPFLQPGSLLPAGSIPEPTNVVTWVQSPDNLLNAIRGICVPYLLGFRLLRNFDTSELYFDIYTGSDRTSLQTVLTPVIFSPDLETIQNTTELRTIQDSKNVAYVFSDVGAKVVYADGVDPSISGFDRRVLIVNTTDVTADTPDIDAGLTDAGKQALAASKPLTYFDGEINQYSSYVYGVDYALGDLVESKNKDGVVTYSRVTEQIFACDEQGERSYPTLATEDVETE